MSLYCPLGGSTLEDFDRDKVDEVVSVVLAVTSRCIQYIGRSRPFTTRCFFLVCCAFYLLPAFASVIALCSHVSRCLVMADLLKSP